MERTIVKVFGERNTGTRTVLTMLAAMPHVALKLPSTQPLNIDGSLEAAIISQFSGSWKRLYLNALRDDAAAERSRHDPWKHAAPVLTPALRAARVRTILMTRNPYSWFLSFARRPYHLKGPKSTTLEGFLHRPWMTERREGIAAILASPMALWSEKLRAAERYLADAGDAQIPSVFMAFEDLVQDNLGAVAAALTDLDMPLDGLEDLMTNTKRGEPAQPTLARVYSAETWRADLTRPLVTGINTLTDWDLAARHGYLPLDPADFPDRLPEARAAQIAHEMSGLSVTWDRDALGAGHAP